MSWPLTLLALLALVSGGVVLGALSRQRRCARALGHGLGAANRALHGHVQESLAGIKVAKILGHEARHLELFRRTTGGLRRQQQAFLVVTSRTRAASQS